MGVKNWGDRVRKEEKGGHKDKFGKEREKRRQGRKEETRERKESGRKVVAYVKAKLRDRENRGKRRA